MHLRTVFLVAGVVVLLSSQTAIADSASWKRVTDLAAVLDLPIAKAKKRVACEASWTTGGQTKTGTEHACGKRRLGVDKRGRVFMSSDLFISSSDRQKAMRLHEALLGDLGKRCKERVKRPQLWIYECKKGIAVIVLENWDSKTDNMDTTVSVGRAAKLFPLLGVSKSK